MLYKYLKSNYAQKMIEEGVIRIGTVYSYQNGENKEQTDLDEGKKVRFTEVIEVNNIEKNEDLPGAFKHIIHIPEDTKLKLSIKGITGQIREEAPDAYVYCVTTKFDDNVMRQFGCDTVVKINNLGCLLELVATALKEKSLVRLDHLGNAIIYAGPCIYSGRRMPYENNTNHYFLKDKEYEHQQEYRFVFVPSKSILKPIILTIPEIRDCVEIM